MMHGGRIGTAFLALAILAPPPSLHGAWVANGVGGAIITWKDERSGNADIYAQRVDAAGHTVVATLLQDYSVAANGPEVGIAWTLSEAGGETEFFVLRARGASVAFAEIAASGTPGSYAGTIVGIGLSFSFSDETCVPGETYRYRVDVRDGGERRVLFETAAITTPELRAGKETLSRTMILLR